MESKICSKCKNQLPASPEFFGTRNRNNKVTLTSSCRRCKNDASNRYNKAHPELMHIIQVRLREKRRNAGTKIPDTKICIGCRTSKSEALFCKVATSKDGLHTLCSSCSSSANKKYKASKWVKVLVLSSKNTASKRGFSHNITEEWVSQQLVIQGGKCYWLGIALLVDGKTSSRHPQKPSLDRLDCSRGYDTDNVVLSSQFANLGRSNVDVKTFREFIQNLVDPMGFEPI